MLLYHSELRVSVKSYPTRYSKVVITSRF
ncbi:unnamed protein product [Acanthoscelides obtectus]|uniref:Uncharacterized protein n=1 Tax=Acanthoscelides obtectus TaxID=200917 RepID=A0A9P0KSQ9_ACAOB|nr:unnamed protein product [Acanthoscelides obtectus]CAK1641205.1 hypothetical protein AOBTE_LOCUS12236 [Acanthoscelides obtectus]